MPHFLIEYDRNTEALVNLVEYTDDAQQEALTELRRSEANKPRHIEVVLLSARSLQDVKRTHSRYFQTAAEIAASVQVD